MSWSMPPPGPWNPMAPTLPPGPMGSCTPEQWAVMQQQNWLQWSQWQQQYAQWQNEYGEKYAQQMQAMQAVGSMPPLPNNSAPPPPPPAPPPDQPPPPPPHENNQPLYGQNQIQPVPVPAPHIESDMNNQSLNANQNRSDSTMASVNTEALKKLAEEERLFDIQFQKWEEEIKKWKKENVNHPDKQAYIEYEQKFEACRAQLLERRQQMNLKRARLLGQVPKVTDSSIKSMAGNIPPADDFPTSGNIPIAGNVPTATNIPTGVPPPQDQNLNQFFLSQNYTTKTSLPPPNQPPTQNIQHQLFNKNSLIEKSPGTHFPQSINNQPFQQQGQPFSQPRNVPTFEHPNNKQQFEKKTFQKPIQREVQNMQQNMNYQNSRSDYDWNNDTIHKTPQSDYDNTNDGPQRPGYSINNTINFNDQYDSLQNLDDECSNSSNFLPAGDSHKGIPGLDLVPDDKAPTIAQEVIDITEEHEKEQRLKNQPLSQGPDYSKISKGINSILGDEKIMNILSMVRNIPVQNANTPNAGQSNSNGLFGGNNNNVQSGIQWSDNRNHQQFDNRQNVLLGNRSATKDLHYHDREQNLQWEENSNKERNLPREQNPEWQQNPQWEKNPHWEVNKQQKQNPQWEQNTRQNNNTQWELNVEYPNKRMFEARQHNETNDNYLDRNQHNIGQNIQPRPLLSIVNLNMPPSQDMLIHQNVHSNQPPGKKGIDESNLPSLLQQPSRPKWIEVPMFNPSIIVEYEHKSLRLKARDFIEPVHTFDYNHKSKEEEKKVDFEREADDLFTRKAKKLESETRIPFEWSTREQPYRDFERRQSREDFRDDSRGRPFPRDLESRSRDYDRQRDYESRPRDYESRSKDYENRSRDYDRRPRDYESRPRDYDRQRDYDSRPREYDDRKRPDEKYDDRKRDDRDKFIRREDLYKSRDREWDKEKDREESERELLRDKNREYKRDEFINPDRDLRKRAFSKETETEDKSVIKKIKGTESPKGKVEPAKHIVMIDDILECPGRDIRPQKIVIILRGPPGSGKSYLAKLIRDREAQNGGTVRIMSIDDYFMQEGEIEEKDPTTGKMVKKPSLKYEYEEKLEETYLSSLKRAFKRTITDGYFTFLIYDAVNDQLKGYADIWNFARQNGFQVYICTLELDPQVCFKRNIHGRTLDDIQVICTRFFPTPAHHIQLDPTTLLQNAAIPDVQMEDASDDVIMEDAQEPEVENIFTSKWDKMDEAAQLARLDGTSKPLRSSQLSMEDYLQLDDWKPSTAKPGKKTVRWADIEERRQQEKMRAIGFVVGQTDWSRMTDPTLGSSALTQTKYIERVKRF